jgi:hypothetical protein
MNMAKRYATPEQLVELQDTHPLFFGGEAAG